MDAGAGDGGRGGSESKKLFANRSHVFPIEIDTLLGRFIQERPEVNLNSVRSILGICRFRDFKVEVNRSSFGLRLMFFSRRHHTPP